MPIPDYFVVMIDYGRRGRQAVADPEMTRRDVVSCIRSGEYRNISFIQHIHDGTAEDVTNELLAEAGFYETEPPEIDRQAARFDHAQDHRKNWVPA